AAHRVLPARQADDPAVIAQSEFVGREALLDRRAHAAVEAGQDAKQLGGLAMTAGEQQDLRERLEDHLGETEEGDDRGFAGLTAAVEQQAPMAGLEYLDLPGVGLQAEAPHDLNSGRSL